MVFILLSVFSFGALFLCQFLRERTHNGPFTSFRLAYVQAAIMLSSLVFLYNEVASAANLITPTSSRLFWLVVSLGAGGWLVYSRRQGLLNLKTSLPGGVTGPGRVDSPSVGIIGAGCLLIIGPLLWLAIYAPPSNFDSHQYHLTRILFWMANRNLDHYPTPHIQQLYHNVFAEYLVLHTFLLTGSDRFANLVQFAAMLGSVLAVSMLARLFGLAYRGQLLAAILMLTLPIGLYEATTTQNDYVACFFFAAFVLFGYRFLQQGQRSELIWCLLSLVLGSFTKYTVMFFALPFVIYFGIAILRKRGFGFGAGVAGGAAGLFGLVFAPFLARNYALFGAVLGPVAGSRFYTEKIPVDAVSVAYTISDTIKNAGLHLGLPYMPYNRWVDSVIEQIHRWLGVSVTDPAVSLNAYHTRFVMQEDMAPNTVHFVLLTLAALLIVFRRGHGPMKLFVALMVVGFVLFSSTFKFQFFSSRTQMPFFALGCVATAYAIGQLLNRSGFWLMVLLYAFGLTVVLGNLAKMVIPVRYQTKRLLAHIPRDICPATPRQRQQFEQVMRPYYRLDPAAACYPLRQPYGFADRQLIFHKLDSINYFQVDKSQSVLVQSRVQAYFSSHPNDYTDYATLLPYVGNDAQNVGMLFGDDSGTYHYWAALAETLHRPVGMAYLRYFREYDKLPNAHQPFRYNYILVNAHNLIGLIDPKTIASVHASGKLTLIRLRQPSDKTYPY